MISSAVYRPIRIAVSTIIDAGTASSSPLQRTSKIVHDHTGIVFTFRWNLRSRSAENRDHDEPQYAPSSIQRILPCGGDLVVRPPRRPRRTGFSNSNTFADSFRRRLRGLRIRFASQLSVASQWLSPSRLPPFAEPAASAGTFFLLPRCCELRPASARHAQPFLNACPALAPVVALAFPLPRLSARCVSGAGRP